MNSETMSGTFNLNMLAPAMLRMLLSREYDNVPIRLKLSAISASGAAH